MTPEQAYIQDLLTTIIERAREAKRSSADLKISGTGEQRAFADGRALGYYEVVSTLVNQARIFGLSADQLPVLSFDVDRNLL